MHESIENGVGERRVPEYRVPVLNWNLTCHERRTVAVTIIKNLQQVAHGAVAHGRHREVVHQQDLRLCLLRQQACVAATTVGNGKILIQPGHLQI